MPDTLGPYLLDTIITGDARELARVIPDESVDLIFTDPPYLREFLPLYGWLAETAARLLKPGGFVLAYCGTYWKFDAQKMLGGHLDYFWDFVNKHAGMGSILWQRKVVARYKSILAFSKGKGLPRCNVVDLWNGSGADKAYHVWGQDESTARYYISCFSAPGAIIFDPFVGGGTTPAVCKVLGRHYLAFEIDPAVAERARQRVHDTQMPLFELEAHTMSMELEVAHA